MNTTSASLGQLSDSTKRVGARLLAIAENRLELLTVELQEERTRLIHALLLSLGLAILGLLIGITLSAVVVLIFWAQSPIGALLGLMALYVVGGIMLYARLRQLCRDWQSFPATIAQFRKDRLCVDQLLD